MKGKCVLDVRPFTKHIEQADNLVKNLFTDKILSFKKGAIYEKSMLVSIRPRLELSEEFKFLENMYLKVYPYSNTTKEIDLPRTYYGIEYDIFEQKVVLCSNYPTACEIDIPISDLEKYNMPTKAVEFE